MGYQPLSLAQALSKVLQNFFTKNILLKKHFKNTPSTTTLAHFYLLKKQLFVELVQAVKSWIFVNSIQLMRNSTTEHDTKKILNQLYILMISIFQQKKTKIQHCTCFVKVCHFRNVLKTLTYLPTFPKIFLGLGKF